MNHVPQRFHQEKQVSHTPQPIPSQFSPPAAASPEAPPSLKQEHQEYTDILQGLYKKVAIGFTSHDWVDFLSEQDKSIYGALHKFIHTKVINTTCPTTLA